MMHGSTCSNHSSLVADIEVRILAHVTFRECHPDWDDLLNKLAACKNKSERQRVFCEHLKEKLKSKYSTDKKQLVVSKSERRKCELANLDGVESL